MAGPRKMKDVEDERHVEQESRRNFEAHVAAEHWRLDDEQRLNNCGTTATATASARATPATTDDGSSAPKNPLHAATPPHHASTTATADAAASAHAGPVTDVGHKKGCQEADARDPRTEQPSRQPDDAEVPKQHNFFLTSVPCFLVAVDDMKVTLINFVLRIVNAEAVLPHEPPILIAPGKHIHRISASTLKLVLHCTHTQALRIDESVNRRRMVIVPFEAFDVCHREAGRCRAEPLGDNSKYYVFHGVANDAAACIAAAIDATFWNSKEHLGYTPWPRTAMTMAPKKSTRTRRRLPANKEQAAPQADNDGERAHGSKNSGGTDDDEGQLSE